MSKPNRSDPHERETRPSTLSSKDHVAVPRLWLLGLAALVLLPWLITWGISAWPASPATPAADGPGVAPSTALHAGPWGHLITAPIVVSPPLEYVPSDMGPVEPRMWYFPGRQPSDLPGVLSAAGLSPDQVARVARSARPDPRINGMAVRPDADIVRGLTPDVRARLYSDLARSPLNFDQQQAYRFLGASEDWLRGSLVSPATQQLITPLLYSVGDFVHFADIESIRPEITSTTELQHLVKALVRQSTMLVRLEVNDLSEVPALADYWGRGGRRMDIRPLLESVAGGGRDRSIDILHLLPALPRSELYRYPRPTAADLSRPVLSNCLWTSLNFFATTPDDRFLDVNLALKSLQEDYFIVEEGFQLGDVLALVDEDGDLFHVAVYLADDLVFSKNGMSPMAPWIITTVDDLKSYYYTHSAAPHLIYHRRNDL